MPWICEVHLYLSLCSYAIITKSSWGEALYLCYDSILIQEYIPDTRVITTSVVWLKTLDCLVCTWYLWPWMLNWNLKWGGLSCGVNCLGCSEDLIRLSPDHAHWAHPRIS
jgi:hypothetical protein